MTHSVPSNSKDSIRLFSLLERERRKIYYASTAYHEPYLSLSSFYSNPKYLVYMRRLGPRKTKSRLISLFLPFPLFGISFLMLFWICLGSNYITPLSSSLTKMYLWLIMYAENKLNIWITLPVIGEIALCFHSLTTTTKKKDINKWPRKQKG